VLSKQRTKGSLLSVQQRVSRSTNDRYEVIRKLLLLPLDDVA